MSLRRFHNVFSPGTGSCAAGSRSARAAGTASAADAEQTAFAKLFYQEVFK